VDLIGIEPMTSSMPYAKLGFFNNLQDPGGSLSPYKHVEPRESAYRKAYRDEHDPSRYLHQSRPRRDAAPRSRA
jgi:hypothetical protein